MHIGPAPGTGILVGDLCFVASTHASGMLPRFTHIASDHDSKRILCPPPSSQPYKSVQIKRKMQTNPLDHKNSASCSSSRCQQ